MSVFVQVLDGKVVSAFPCAQDPSYWPGVIEVEETDQLYVDYLSSLIPSPNLVAESTRDQLLSIAALRIAPLQDAADLKSATHDETEALALWKQYRVDLNRVQKQKGYPIAIKWPDMPQNNS